MKMDVTKKRKRGRPSLKKEIDLTKVLEIAITSFANNGFAGTSMNTIAEEAGYTKAVLHYHFGNKENLWKEGFLHMNKKIMQRYEETHRYVKDLKGLAALKVYTRQLIYFAAEYPEFYKLTFHEMCTKTDRATWMIENILAPLQQASGGGNLDAQEKEFQGYPIANLASITIGAVNMFFVHAFQMEQMYGVNPFEKAEIEKHADIVIDLLYARFEE